MANEVDFWHSVQGRPAEPEKSKVQPETWATWAIMLTIMFVGYGHHKKIGAWWDRRNKKLWAKWALGLFCGWGFLVTASGCDLMGGQCSYSREGNYLFAAIFLTFGSVSFYSAIRWLWRNLL